MALIAWFRLDGDLVDTSGNGVVATATTTPTYAEGKIGIWQSMNTGAFTVPKGILNKYVQTISFWYYNVRPSSSTTGNHQISGGSPRYYGMFAYPNNDDFHVSLYDESSGANIVGTVLSGVLACQKWTHIALVNDSGILKQYINGDLKRTDDISSWNRNFDSGAYQLVHNSAYHRIDDLKIYNNALSDSEVKELAKAKILHFTFNDRIESTLNYIGNQSKGTGETRTGWEANQTVTLSNAVNKNGKMGIKCVSGQSSSTPGMYIDLSLTKNGVYTMSAEVQSDCDIMFGYLTTSTYTPVQKYDFPTKMSVTFTASAASVRLYFFMSGMSTGQYFIATDIQVEEGATPTKFVHNTRTDTIYDASGYTHNASLPVSTSPRWTEDCAIGVGAFQFDGTRYISSPLPTIPANGDFTVSFWGFTQDNQNQCFVCTRTATGNGFSIFLLNNRQIRIDTEVSYQWYPGYTLPLNTWVHIAVVVKQSISKALYINGVLFSSTSAVPSGSLSIGTYQTIGVSQSNGTSFGNYLKGKVDDFRVYVTALSAEDIMDLYKVRKEIDNMGNLYANYFKEVAKIPTTSVSSGLSLWCPLDGTADEVIGGGKGYAVNVSVTSGLGGKSAFQFNGASSYIQLFPIEITQAITVCAWIYWETGGTTTPIFVSKRESSPNVGYSWEFGIMSNPQEQLGARINANSNISLTSQAIPRNQWVFVYFTYNRSSIDVGYSLYGSSTFSSNMASFTTAISSTPNVYIALGRRFHSGAEEWFKGKMQDVKIYNRKLTSSELGTVRDEINLNSYYEEVELTHKGVYKTNTLSEKASSQGLMCWYPFNGNVLDYSLYGHHGENSNVTFKFRNKTQYAEMSGNIDSYVKSPFSMPGGPFTVSLWFYVRNTSQDYQGLLGDKWYSASGGGTQFNMGLQSNKLYYHAYDNSKAYHKQRSETISLNQWYHFAVVYSGGEISSYVNGANKITESTNVVLVDTHIDVIRLGVWMAGSPSSTWRSRPLYGGISNFRFYNYPLNDEEMQIIYDIEIDEVKKIVIQGNNTIISGEFKEL